MSLSVRILRIIEWVLLITFVGSVAAAGYIWTNNMLPEQQQWGIIGIAALVLTMKIALQTVVDQKIRALEVSSEVTTDVAYTALYERSPVAYITIDALGGIVAFNAAAVNLLQVPRDRMNEQNMYALISDDQNAAVNAAVLRQKIEAGLTITDQEVLFENGVGQTLWVSMSVYGATNPQERMIALVDITEKKMIDTAKSEFVALATHQLRTPIAAIRWNVELLEKKLRGITTEDHDRYLVKINRNVNRMIALINDFLNVSKLEMGTFAASAEQLNLETFMSGIQDEFTEQISQKQLDFRINVSPPGVVIKTDPRLFHIIVSNLASNAVKYTTANGEIEAHMKLVDSMLTIEVSDSGIGIPEDEMSKLFSKFFRASNATAQQAEGTGLGLYVVKQSVEQLGGTIQVQSIPEQGTRFVAQIPVQVVEIA